VSEQRWDWDKKAGEWKLSQGRFFRHFYDAKEAQKLALRDGWGISDAERAALAQKLGRDPTKREIAAKAVQIDFELLRDWCEGRWYYLDQTVSLWKLTYDGEKEIGQTCIGYNSLGSVESYGDYWKESLSEIANNLTANYDKERTESQYWAERDVETV
jgi:hypothetical protein